MKRIASLLFLTLALCSLVAVAGCQSGTIQAAAVDGAFRRVAARHDVYVASDPLLSPLEKRIDLRDTELLRGVLNAAKPATQPAGVK
jgi:hypothetical protein